jgi:hypothetical protein
MELRQIGPGAKRQRQTPVTMTTKAAALRRRDVVDAGGAVDRAVTSSS